jgi:5'-nucleotidase / UDP-sugar diphosphatase
MRRSLLALLTVVAMLGLIAPGADARGGPPSSLFADVTVHDASASESDEVIEFEVTLDEAVNRPTHLWYSTEAGTALPFRDYVPVVRRKATIPRGETSTTLTVELIDNDEVGDNLEFEVVVTTAPPFLGGVDRATGTIRDDDRSLNILHINDHHSHLEPDGGTLVLGGVSTPVELGGFPSVVAKFRELEAELAGENVVKIHAGDAITGTLYYSLFKGQADAELMNELCFDVFILGNHEFDDSDAGLAQFLDWLAEGDCDTPVLAANVVPEVGTPLAPTGPDDYIQPYVIEDYGDLQVGYIGIDIASKTRFSSSPLPTTQFLDELTTAQQYIDELTAMGIDQIVLVTHYTYEGDLALAAGLTGVDVIVGGDSHTLLGDQLSAVGLSPGGPYPTRTTDADGKLVCVVQAWQYSWVVGHLEVVFDGDGDVVSCDGTPHVILGDTFAADSPARAVIDATPELSIVTPDPAAQAILDTYSAEVEVLKQTVVGETTDFLCIERIPGFQRSANPDCWPLTAVHGGIIQQLVTEGFRQRSFEADIALQNAGGVRVELPVGPITIADVFEVLPFANTMVNMEMTGAEIKQVLEEAGAYVASNPSANSGAYPYGAGIRWDANMSAPTGERFTNLEVRLKGETEWSPIDPDATYTVVTNSFLARGGDGWFTFGDVSDSGRATDTFLDYAQAFIDYIVIDRGGVVGALPVEEYSTQTFIGFS